MRNITNEQEGKAYTPGFIRTLSAALLLALSIHAQQPVTGGEDLVPHVRALKLMGNKVHLEWLYLEDAVDQLPYQRELVRSGRPVEFTEGYLYHGRGGLDDALISGWISGESYFTRAPHVWAVGSFRRGISGPAVVMVDALEFNRLRDAGQAVLEAECDREAGIMDPYPKITSGFSVELALEIWIDQDTSERYQRLQEKSDAALTPREMALKRAVQQLQEAGRLKYLTGLRHSRLDDDSFYAAAYEIVGAYFTGRNLTERIPRIRPRESGRGS